MKPSAPPTKTEKLIASPFNNQKEVNNYNKTTTHLAATMINYLQTSKSPGATSLEINFRDTIIGREIIEWHANLKRQLFENQS